MCVRTCACACCWSVKVHNVVNVPQSFHARFDATHREYVFRIICPTTASTKATAVTTHDGDPNCAGSSNRSDNRSTEKDDDDNNKGKPQKKQQQQQQHRADGAVWMPENPFEHNRCWQVRRTLNIKEMQKAAATLEGTHDFSSFRGAGCQAASPIKTVETVNVTALPLSSSALNFQTHMPPRTGGEVRSSSPSALSSVSSVLGTSPLVQEVEVRIKANSFLYNQVRNIVAALVEVVRKTLFRNAALPGSYGLKFAYLSTTSFLRFQHLH